MREEEELTGVGDGGADELEADALPQELVQAVEQRGVEVVEVQHVLLHQQHRAFHRRRRLRGFMVLPGDGVKEAVQHLASRSTNPSEREREEVTSSRYPAWGGNMLEDIGRYL